MLRWSLGDSLDAGATEYLLYAEARMGEMLAAIPKDGTRHSSFGGTIPSLPPGIDKKQSHYTHELSEKSYFKAVAGRKKVSKEWRFGPLVRRRCGPRIWLFRWRCFFLTAGQEKSQSQEEKQQNTACFNT